MRNVFYVRPEDIREYMEISRLDDEEDTSLEGWAAAQGEWAVREYEESGLLPRPELLSYGWLTLTELRENLAHAKLGEEELSPPYRAMMAALAPLAESVGAEKARLVFWLGM